MAVTSDAGRRFAARWARYALGPIDLNLLASTRQEVSRTAGMVSQDGSASFELVFARSGAINVEHCGRRAVVAPGSFMLLDNEYPWHLSFPHGGDCPTVHMAKDWLLALAPGAQDRCGVPLGHLSAWTRPLAGYLTAIADEGLASMDMPRHVIADQLGALANLLIAGGISRSRDRDLGRRIRDCIADAYGAHDLCPARVARELSISTRHLHRVLAQDGTSFGRVLRETRMAAAASLLMDDRTRTLSIGEVAWRVGYPDQSHFARVFRAAHGCSPVRFRNATCAGAN